eukprot:SAG31_NODE_7122_length_1783_cov_1.274941_2_plen_140_part_00
MLRVNSLICGATCDRLRRHIDESLQDARAAAEADDGVDRADFFGDVYGEGQRWDMYLRLQPAVLLILKEAISKLLPALTELVSDEARLCELSSLISDGGSARQPLHPDTAWQVGLAPLVTCFIALQVYGYIWYNIIDMV